MDAGEKIRHGKQDYANMLRGLRQEESLKRALERREPRAALRDFKPRTKPALVVVRYSGPGVTLGAKV